MVDVGYPLVMVMTQSLLLNMAAHLQWMYLLKIIVFHSYLSSPEGSWDAPSMREHAFPVRCFQVP